MNNKLLPKVTIGISAYNEEKNIKALLDCISKQKEEGFTIDKIVLISDGSTDNTVKIARSFRAKKIVIFDDKKRLGKSQRLNELYKAVKSDILVQSDADVLYGHGLVIKELVEPLIKSDNTFMSGGNSLPIKGKTFVQRALNRSFYAYYPLRKKLKYGDNILSSDGKLLAYKKKLYKKIRIPKETTANDDFTYLTCIKNGYLYKHAAKADVYFSTPKTVKDLIKQNTRFKAAPRVMERYFSKELIIKEYNIPLKLLLPQLTKQFINNPIESLFIGLVNLYCKIQSSRKNLLPNALWDVAHSTKILS